MTDLPHDTDIVWLFAICTMSFILKKTKNKHKIKFLHHLLNLNASNQAFSYPLVFHFIKSPPHFHFIFLSSTSQKF